MSRELVFVYNADSGPWSKLFDAGHKLISPSTYPCRLCALTYGAATMRGSWSRFIEGIPHRVRFAYRDEARRDGVEVAPPALVERREGGWITLLDRAAIEACDDLDALIARVREVT
jgi:hypothetical protein